MVTVKDWPWSADHLGMGATATLNLFRDGINARSEGEPAIPCIGDEPWRFTTRQLRRTVAWYIANRPFCTIAGKIQYEHASVAMFEGYAGSARADFRLAVERERALGQLDDIVAHYEAFFATTVRRGQERRGCGGSSRMCGTSSAIFRPASWMASGCAPCSLISAGPYMSASSMIAFSKPRQRSALRTRRTPSGRHRPCPDAAPTAARTPV
ncbi:hypothetical protein ACFSQQ_27955 [Mesorhizobium kowhaii]|uniref:hypothetical protein n=1 Tax=Mesorhizobium kowhaii TaxID=1300272 RepID=UPI0035E729E2